MTQRDEMLAGALGEIGTPPHAAGFEDRLHDALTAAAPGVRRSQARRRVVAVALVAALTLMLAAGVGWAAVRVFPRPVAPAPRTMQSLPPTASPAPSAPTEEKPEAPEPEPAEPVVPERPSAEEAKDVLLGGDASHSFRRSDLEAKVSAVVEAGDAWWVLGWVRQRWDAPTQTDALMVIARRPHGEERWQGFYSGTNLTHLVPLKEQLPDCPREVREAVLEKLLKDDPFPKPRDAGEWPKARLVERVQIAAGRAPVSELLPDSGVDSSSFRIAEGDDGRWWASALLTADSGERKGESVRVFFRWSEEELEFVYVGHSGDPATLESIPAEVRARL